jgi:hypothetical protein
MSLCCAPWGCKNKPLDKTQHNATQHNATQHNKVFYSALKTLGVTLLVIMLGVAIFIVMLNAICHYA